jgi:hypothetical protein
MKKNNNEPEIICHWNARKLKPIILIYVSLIFISLIIVSYFVLHSTLTVKALSITAIGTIIPLFFGVITRIKYRLTKHSLEYQSIFKNKSSSFKTVFKLDQQINIKLTRNGFKFYHTLTKSNPLKRFWKTYILAGFSGEVYIEKVDVNRVFDALKKCGVRYQ